MDKKRSSSTIDKKEYFETLNKIIFFITNAQTLANKINIKNLSQPGIIKEIITAYTLKHRLNPTKKQHDAEDFDDANIRYEYLSCLENKTFQFDRVNEENLKKRVKERNTKIYCSIFHKENSLKLLRVYEVDPNKMYKILMKKYKNSSSSSRHVNVSEEEIINIGSKLIYPKNKS